MADKLKMHSLNKADENYQALAKLFPNAVTETIVGYDEENKPIIERAIDADVLRQEISTKVVEGRDERYQFTWPDKKKAILSANAPIAKTLRPCREESVDFDNTENLYIEGDNLDVLKLLQESYLGKVKMIYIDPPYNTGKDFIYEDNFRIAKDVYIANSGQIDDGGNRLVQNTDSNGRFHTDWLNMIYPRLRLAKDLLREDGVIFISIDDNEVENLKKICAEIFGENNIVAQIVWEKVHTRKNSAKYFSNSHEYILCIAKNKKVVDSDIGWSRNLLPRDDTSAYKNPDNDPKGPWKADPITAHNFYDANYKIYKPNGVVLERPQNRYWVYSEESWRRKIENNEVIWGEGDSYPMIKRYLSEVQNGLVPVTLFSREFAGDSSLGNKDLANTLNLGALFTYPKPIKLLMRLMQIGTNENDIVLDFFSGSGTTAHAMMELESKDQKNRKYILVQLPESTDPKSETYKAGFETICELGKERIRAAGNKISQEIKNVDIGFRVLKVDSSNMKDVYYNPGEYQQTLFDSLIDSIKPDRTPEDLLFQVMLDLGVLLSSKIDTVEIAGKNVFSVEDDYLIACFDDNVTEEVVKEIALRQPYYAVFRDSSIANDSVATNFEQIFETYSPTTVRKVL